jgi:hypothetical protein
MAQLRLKRLHLYRLSGMRNSMWQVGHPDYGKPNSLVGMYIGCWKATRKWYGFEIRVGGKERGVIFMPESDLNQLTLEYIGPTPPSKTKKT